MPGEGEAISCVNYNPKGEGAIYRYEGGMRMRHYPSPEIANSWDPNWGSGADRKIDCTGFTLDPDMPLLPQGEQDARIFQQNVRMPGQRDMERRKREMEKQDARRAGQIMCKADGTWSNNSPVSLGTVITRDCPTGGFQTATCRADGGWDSDGKCLPRPGEAISCVNYNPKGEGAIYRYEGNMRMRHYPSPEIANSWDPNWGSGVQRKIDCTGFTLDPDVIKRL